jgi:histone H2A
MSSEASTTVAAPVVSQIEPPKASEPVVVVVPDAAKVKSPKPKSKVTAKQKAKSVSSSVRSGIIFPAGRISRFLRKARYGTRMSRGAGIYLAAVLEYLTSEILELSGNVTKSVKCKRIVPRHIYLAMQNDEEFAQVFKNITLASSGVQPGVHPFLVPAKKVTVV